MENECEALPGVAYPGVRDNRSTINTKTGYDDDQHSHTASVTDDSLQRTVRHAACPVVRGMSVSASADYDPHRVRG